jgi:antitoxin component of MazEF toxin-antitoxin module
MNKKLVKYGNSYALVLNKSILELLDIDGNDPVKLKIEGDTLLVKKSAPLNGWENIKLESNAATDKKSKAEYSKESRDADMLKATIREALLKNPNSKLEDIVENADLPSQAKRKALPAIDAFQALFQKYNVDMKMFSENKAYQDELAKLESIKDTMSTNEYRSQLMEIRYQHFPQLREFDRESISLEKNLETLD